jgi:Xaa-Pro dipeptidase
MSPPEGGKKAPPRVERLKRGIAKQDIDVLVAFKPEVTFYLTGFTPIIYSNPVVVIVPDGGS